MDMKVSLTYETQIGPVQVTVEYILSALSGKSGLQDTCISGLPSILPELHTCTGLCFAAPAGANFRLYARASMRCIQTDTG
ncbi:hypothetical protein BABINDRAFT_110858 [Babjeviella inositovora NRRL Y-12698]|uniref:Uncharacterized protein n=1 Tax=Babjeviella inositovora NRRL Y-12698 TaxID=984486 RepID=A0A1E3QVP2_9ASCO|nr:uncharacterized protein BABINDRAFT_110858 [Babjeviella inositovora NRRL Y-12698]ODQ81729.1 hypothetical protein BABINDRAFT_110858 [Babjeviella inositovora NRRL Y-12698]